MKFKIGIGIIILAFLVSSWNPFLLLFCIPVFIIGILVLWMSKAKNQTKIGWSIYPIVLWYPFMSLTISIYLDVAESFRPKYDFIFQNNFSGTAVIIENQSCGQKKKKVDGRFVIEFPADGILLYDGKTEYVTYDHRYYIRDINGSLNKLDDFNFASLNDSLQPENKGVKFDYSIVQTIDIPPHDDTYICTIMVVSSRDSLDYHRSIGFNDKTKGEIRELVINCRNNNIQQ